MKLRVTLFVVAVLLLLGGVMAGSRWRLAAQTPPAKPAEVDAAGTGLQGYYFAGLNFDEMRLVRVDPNVNFDWNGQAPAPDFPRETISVRWIGKVQPKYSETYTFYVCCDDGQRLWVNGQLLVDDWTMHGATERSGTIELKAGQKYDIRMEFNQGSGGASAQLSWSSPSQPKEVIPQKYLYAPLLEGGKLVWDDNTDIRKSIIWGMNAEGEVKKLTEAGAAQPALSRDGKRIVFVSARHATWNDPKVTPNTELYVMNSDGSAQRRITQNLAGEMTPAFSPNGQKIAYASNRDGNWQLYISNYDGSFTKRVTNNTGFDCNPTFSPNGKQLAFQSKRDNNWEIYTINIDGSEETKITTHGGRAPIYTPDGSKIAYLNTVEGKTNLYLMNADGSGDPKYFLLPAGENNSPIYSPYGCEMAFVSKSEGEKLTAVSTMRIDGTGISRMNGLSGCVNISWGL